MFSRGITENGIRVVTEEIPYVRSASVGVWFKTGSRNEADHNQGLSHFIEHLLFKGTKTRSARQIAEAIDDVGGQLNAFTSKEYTCYYVKALDNHFPLAIEILSDMILNSLFDPVEMEKEKGVIYEEIRMYEDSPDELAHDLLLKAIWGDHPLGYNTLGTHETVRGISREMIFEYMKEHYMPKNIVISVVGNVKHEYVMDMISKAFGSHSGNVPKGGNPAPALKRRKCLKEKDIEQVHLCIGTEGFSRTDKRKYALSVLDSIVGGGMSSRLFQELREERGLVYSTYSYHTSFIDTGLFAIYAGMSPKNTAQVLEIISSELDRIRHGDIREKEINRAKEQLKGNLVMSLENTSNRMSRLAKQELFYDRIYTPEETMAFIDSVTIDDLLKVAEGLPRMSGFSVSAVGPGIDSLGIEKFFEQQAE